MKPSGPQHHSVGQGGGKRKLNRVTLRGNEITKDDVEFRRKYVKENKYSNRIQRHLIVGENRAIIGKEMKGNDEVKLNLER